MIKGPREVGKKSFGKTWFIIHIPHIFFPRHMVGMQHSQNKPKIHFQWFYESKNYVHSRKFTTRRLSFSNLHK